MKYLLTIALAIGLSNTAYSACSAGSPQDCKDEADCQKLNSNTSGQKFDFGKERSVKCMVVSASAADNCMQIVDGARKEKPSGAAAAAAGKDAATQGAAR